MADTIEHEISTTADAPQPAVEKSRSSWLALVITIIICSLLGAGGYYLWQQQQGNLKNQLSVNSDLQQQLQTINSSFNQLGNTLKSQIANDQQQFDALKNQQDEISAITQKAISITSRNQKEWTLAEIDYLLRIASRRLQISNDINSAIAAMTAADQRIFDLGDLSLFPIRKQLNKDIASLKSLHQVDVNGAAMAIDQMLALLSSLPFKSINDEIKAQLTKPEIVAETRENSGFLDSVIDTVMDIGDIKIHHRSLQPAASAVQQDQVEHTLQTHLLAARLSLLRYDQVQFRYELKQSLNILLQFYNLTDNRVVQLQTDIDKLNQITLLNQLPNIDSSWKMLQQAMVTKKTTGPEVEKPSIKKPQLIEPEKEEAL